MEHDIAIEALLFYRAEPILISELSKLLAISPEEIVAALLRLQERYTGRGISIVHDSTHAEMRTSPATAEFLSQVEDIAFDKDISSAAMETLSIVLYCSPISRAEIDYIRGVSSQFSIRNLLVRGLIQKEGEASSVRYVPTIEVLAFLGVDRVTALPDYETIKRNYQELKQRE